MAGGGQATLAFDVDEAGAAGAQGRPIRILAELGQSESQAIHGVQHRGAHGDFDQRAVDSEAEAHGDPINPECALSYLAPRGQAASVPDPGLRERNVLGGYADGRPLDAVSGGRGQPEQVLNFGSPIEPLALDALAVALQEAPADIGVEGLALDAEEGCRLVARQVLLAIQNHHHAILSVPNGLDLV